MIADAKPSAIVPKNSLPLTMNIAFPSWTRLPSESMKVALTTVFENSPLESTAPIVDLTVNLDEKIFDS